MKIRAIASAALLLIVGCGPSNQDVEEIVKASMQKTFSTDSKYGKYRMSVQRVMVIHEEGNRYQGMADIQYEGKTYNVALEITSDGSNVIWKAAQGAFLFLAQHEIAKLQSFFEIDSNAKPTSFSFKFDGDWTVQAASLSFPERAEKLKKDLQSKGYSSYIVIKDGMNRVFVGPISDRVEAERVRDKIHQEFKLDPVVVRTPESVKSTHQR